MDLDALGKLPRFKWRDTEYPVLTRSVSFAHEGAEHRLQYRDDDFIEQLGPHSLTFTYTLPMRQGIASGPYKDLFTTGYDQLFVDCRDRVVGVLVDPRLGLYDCVPVSWSDDMDVNRRDGTDIRVEFKHSPKIDEADIALGFTVQGLESEAGALDAELGKVDWEQEPSPEPTMDALNAISGFGAQLEAQGGKVTAALEDFAYKYEKIDQQIDRLENPDVWPLKRAVRRNRAVAVNGAKRAKDPTKTIRTVTNNHNRTLSALAAEHDMTIAELLEQNPALAKFPYVSSGTVVNVIAPSGR